MLCYVYCKINFTVQHHEIKCIFLSKTSLTEKTPILKDPTVCVMLRGHPLNYETGWTGEFWLLTNLLQYQTYDTTLSIKLSLNGISKDHCGWLNNQFKGAVHNKGHITSRLVYAKFCLEK